MAFSLNHVHCWDKGSVTEANSRFVVAFPNNKGFSSNDGSSVVLGDFLYEPIHEKNDEGGIVSEYGRFVDFISLPESIKTEVAKLMMSLNDEEWAASHSPSGIEC